MHGRAINTVRIDPQGRILWNGKGASWQELTKYLRITHEMIPQPLTLFRPSPSAPCIGVQQVRSLMARELRCHERDSCGEGPEWSTYPDQQGFDI